MIRKTNTSETYQHITTAHLSQQCQQLIRSDNYLSILNWQPEYLSHFISKSFTEIYHGDDFQKNYKIRMEDLLARCCWYHKDTNKQVAEFFKEVEEISLHKDTREQVMERLKIMNMLTLIDWFPKHLIKVPAFENRLDKLTQVYLLNLIKYRGEENVVINESQYVQ